MQTSIDEDTRPRLEGENRTDRKPSTRSLLSYVPVVAAIVGATLVVGGVVFFYVESDLRRLITVSIGLAIVMIGVWFAANPFIRSRRRFKPLRKEVDEFVDLVRVLNAQAVEKAESDDVERTVANMHKAVERMVARADQTS